MQQFFLLLLLAFSVTLALAALAGQAIARRALRPLEEMALRAEGISANSLDDRLKVVNPSDELGHLASAFNHLLERLEQAFQQLERFTADAAHELRTPLASLRTVGEVAVQAEHAPPEAYKEAISSILEEAARLNATIDSLLLLSRAETATPGSGIHRFTVGALISEVLSLLAILIEERQLAILQEGQELGATELSGDRSLIRMALLNVVHNAIKFSPANSSLLIRLQTPALEPPAVEIVVEDQGPGLRERERERVFERFFRGSSATVGQTPGTGLGLSISKLVVDRSGGAIWFDPQHVTGARCIIQLRVVASATALVTTFPAPEETP